MFVWLLVVGVNVLHVHTEILRVSYVDCYVTISYCPMNDWHDLRLSSLYRSYVIGATGPRPDGDSKYDSSKSGIANFVCILMFHNNGSMPTNPGPTDKVSHGKPFSQIVVIVSHGSTGYIRKPM